MPTRRFVLAAAAALVVATPLRAADDTPEAFVAAIYARVTAGDGTAGGADITGREARARSFTRSLVSVWNAADDKAEKDGDIGPVEFDVLTDSQDPEVRRTTVDIVAKKPDSAVIRVSLYPRKQARPGERPASVLDFVLKREDGAWRIDDVKRVSRSEPWSLRGLLATP